MLVCSVSCDSEYCVQKVARGSPDGNRVCTTELGRVRELYFHFGGFLKEQKLPGFSWRLQRPSCGLITLQKGCKSSWEENAHFLLVVPWSTSLWALCCPGSMRQVYHIFHCPNVILPGSGVPPVLLSDILPLKPYQGLCPNWDFNLFSQSLT